MQIEILQLVNNSNVRHLVLARELVDRIAVTLAWKSEQLYSVLVHFWLIICPWRNHIDLSVPWFSQLWNNMICSYTESMWLESANNYFSVTLLWNPEGPLLQEFRCWPLNFLTKASFDLSYLHFQAQVKIVEWFKYTGFDLLYHSRWFLVGKSSFYRYRYFNRKYVFIISIQDILLKKRKKQKKKKERVKR